MYIRFISYLFLLVSIVSFSEETDLLNGLSLKEKINIPKQNYSFQLQKNDEVFVFLVEDAIQHNATQNRKVQFGGKLSACNQNNINIDEYLLVMDASAYISEDTGNKVQLDKKVKTGRKFSLKMNFMEKSELKSYESSNFIWPNKISSEVVQLPYSLKFRSSKDNKFKIVSIPIFHTKEKHFYVKMFITQISNEFSSFLESYDSQFKKKYSQYFPDEKTLKTLPDKE